MPQGKMQLLINVIFTFKAVFSDMGTVQVSIEYLKVMTQDDDELFPIYHFRQGTQHVHCEELEPATGR